MKSRPPSGAVSATPDPSAAVQTAPPARADLGDDVYYRHPVHQVTYGKIIAHGQHGATCRHEDGETHQVLWEDLLGHRKRRERAFSIVDQGEDGAILTDERGKRHFLAGDLPVPDGDPDQDLAQPDPTQDPAQPLAKALLVDLAPLSCGCTDHALEDLHKALSEDQPDIWAPHDSLWIRDLIERLTADGLEPLEELRVSLWAWLEGQFHITHPVPPPDLLAPWSPSLAAAVKAYLQGKPQGEWSAQDWSLWVDYLIRTYLPVERLQAAVTEAQRQGTALGAIRATLAENLAPAQALAIVNAIREAGNLARAEDLAHLNRTQAAYAQVKAADLIVELTDRARHGIKRLVLDHLEQNHLAGVSPAANWRPLEQALRDQFGDLNRDWRRIAITEVGEAHNQGFVATLPAGTYVRRLEVYAGACAFCRKIDGAILQVVDPAKENKDWDHEVWAGKTNVGRSGSPRKRVGNVLVERTDSELWKIPAGLVHPHCFLSPRIPIYTTSGWKPIVDIQVGDQVLTHAGRFQAVNWVLTGQRYTGPAVRLRLGRKNGYWTGWMTPEHPLLTATGWKAAGEIQVEQDRLTHLGRQCPTCQQPFANPKHQQIVHCGNACTPKSGINQYSDPLKREGAIAHTSEMNRKRMRSLTVEQRRQLTANGRAVMAARGYDHLRGHESASAKSNAKLNYQPSATELAVAEVLVELGCEPSLQLRVPSQLRDRAGRKRYWWLDLALPAQKIAVEIDGDPWHRERQEADARRDADLAQVGWTVMRFNNVTARQSPQAVAEQIARVAMNHAHEYVFADLDVVAMEWRDVNNRKLYNFGVDEDESYIVSGGLVVHNCRGRFVTIDGIAKRDDLTRWLFEEIIPQESTATRPEAEPEPDPKQDFAAWVTWKLRQSRPEAEG